MRDHVRFFAEFRRRFHTTGAIAPSSRFLGRALSRSLATPAAPRRILEVGPGTGAVTREIIRRLQPGDTLDLVELNEAFVRHLEERFESDAAFRPVRGQCRVHHLPLEDMPASEPYDCIISGLPLNNFSPEVVRSIFARIFELLAPGGTLSYFEYMFVRGIRGSLARGAERQRLQGLEEIIGPLLRQHRVRRDWIFRNLPPAWVQHLQIAAEAPVPEPAREVDPAAEAPAGTGEFRS